MYKVIRTTDGDFGVTTIPEPDRVVIFESHDKQQAMDEADRLNDSQRSARFWRSVTVYVSIIVGLSLWAASELAEAASIDEVTWTPATTNVDGSTIEPGTTRGFNVYVGPSSGDYRESVYVDGDVLGSGGPVVFVANWLQPGTNYVYVAVTQINNLDEESDYSNELRRPVYVTAPTPNAPILIRFELRIDVDVECPTGYVCTIGDQEVTP